MQSLLYCVPAPLNAALAILDKGMDMDDLKSLLIGIIGTLIVMLGVHFFKSQRRKSLKEDVELIELELQVLEKMKRSSVEMNRASFRGLYALLFLFGLTNLVTSTFEWFAIQWLDHLKYIILVLIWSTFVAIALVWWKRYDNLKNYSEAVNRLQEKKAKKEASLSRLEQ